jgi:hypothetical protein
MSQLTIICDIDGTIADLTHRLHHINTPGQRKNWDAFFEACPQDKPHKDIINLLLGYLSKPWLDLVFVSGRSAIVRNQTTNWLREQGFTKFDLYMRQEKDHRPDHITKAEIYNKYLKHRDIWFVLDDRDRVVQMWRDHGLRCLQVAPGNF